MRRGIAWAVLPFAAVVITALAALVAWSSASTTSTPTASSNRRVAEATASKLLEETPLPAGAQQVSSDESALGVLRGPALSQPRTPQLVQTHRFWRVEGAPEQAISWIEAHPPAGSQLFERGSSATGAETTSWEAAFSFGRPNRVLSTVWLSVLAAAAKGGGTALRADATVVWTQPRPAAEHIPAGVKVVSVKAYDPRRRISFSEEVSDPTLVREIVALVEGLLRPEGGAASCPADEGREPVVSLAFRRNLATPPSARVRIDGNACGSVEFWRGRHMQPPLGDAFEALKALRRLLHRRL